MFHISEPEFVNRSQRLSDVVYAQVLDSVVVACVDCAVVCGKEIFLGKRTDEPAKNEWWIQGGRMQVGLDPRRTVQAILLREIGLSVEIDDIIDLNLSISYVWSKRSQPPEGHGCHMVGMYYVTYVDEACRDVLANVESNENFSGFAWRSIRGVSQSPELHRGIVQLAKRILEVS